MRLHVLQSLGSTDNNLLQICYILYPCNFHLRLLLVRGMPAARPFVDVFPANEAATVLKASVIYCLQPTGGGERHNVHGSFPEGA